ncbi:MAG: prepilin-type N-terminal cleavage/methylation domain-containing protein [Dehalococcoidia bacterium]|nr:prepilin-type N-terminal cleavage/methylation domain-containing protein [Dehalococcoidia bacterium]
MRGIVRRLGMLVAKRDDSRGQLLIEVLIALALLGMIATVFIGAMYTALHSARIADERSIAVTLAKSEIEYVKEQPYSTSVPWGYTVTYVGGQAVYSDEGSEPSWWPDNPDDLLWQSSPDFDGYSISISGVEEEASLQRITAIALHHDAPVLTLENYRLDR